MLALDFIKQYYNDSDTFFIGILDRKTNKYNQYKHTLHSIEQHISKITYHNKNNKDIYLSLNCYDNSNYRTKSNINTIKSLFFDIDQDGEVIKGKIIDTFGIPTYVIQTSSNKYQLIYQFQDPLSKEHIENVENIGEILSKHFHTDKTFDTTRIFRAPNFINNKNGFNVKYIFNNTYFDISLFQEYIEKNNLKVDPKTNTPIKSKPISKNIKNTQFNQNNKYYKTYQTMLKKVQNDNNRADIKFIKYLLHKKMKKENIIKNLFEVRNDIFTKHKDIDFYIDCTFSKIYQYEPELIKFNI